MLEQRVAHMEQTLKDLCKRFDALGINANRNHDRDKGFVKDGAHSLPINKAIPTNPCKQSDYAGDQEDYNDQGEVEYVDYNRHHDFD